MKRPLCKGKSLGSKSSRTLENFFMEEKQFYYSMYVNGLLSLFKQGVTSCFIWSIYVCFSSPCLMFGLSSMDYFLILMLFIIAR